MKSFNSELPPKPMADLAAAPKRKLKLSLSLKPPISKVTFLSTASTNENSRYRSSKIVPNSSAVMRAYCIE